MLLDLWEWFLLINDGIDLVLSNLASGTYPVPFSFLLVITLLGLISLFAWRSTDIHPDLPPAPRPPYVIQITTGPAPGTSRQTISDVRLLSGGFFEGHEILNRYRSFAARTQATNTDNRSQTSRLAQAAGEIEGGGEIRNVELRGPLHANNTIRRDFPSRSFLLGLFRRPEAVVRSSPTSLSNSLRAQLTSSPNVVVYHRVNVYHHHIHNHNHHSGQQNNTPGSNIQVANAGSSQRSSSEPSSSSSTQTQSFVSAAPDIGSTAEPSPTVSPITISDNDLHTATEDREAPNNVALASSNVFGNTIETIVNPSTSDSDPVVSIRVPSSAVQSHENRLHHLIESDNTNSIASASSPEKSNMPAEQERSTEDKSGAPQENIPQEKTASVSNHHPNAGDENDVRFTIKFLNDTQMDVTSQLNEKIVDFKRRHFATEMSENKTVRLIFNGRVLDNDGKTLRDFGIFDQCVVHCLIVNRQQNQDQSRNSSSDMSSGRGNSGQQGGPAQGNMRRVGLPEPGMFFIAFIGIFLIFLWFICLHFGQHLFTQSAVVSLTVLTAIFLIGIVACYLPLPAN